MMIKQPAVYAPANQKTEHSISVLCEFAGYVMDTPPTRSMTPR